ncbi:MAG: ABC-2 family transporter protein [Thermoclostridium sp.]|nr:ABC-2 family transporter protein [Thermoclostridium sp.]
MKKYISFFRMRFINGLQYRAAAYAGIATQFAWGFMEILMFRAFYRANPQAFPMEFSQLSSYIWLQQAFLALFMTWFLENDIFSAITSGNVAYELVRPMNLYRMWFVKNLASRLSKAVLRCLPILVVAAFLPAPYNISLPLGLPEFISFIISMILGFLAAVAFCMLIYIATFYTMSPMGVRLISVTMVEFLSGGVIPIPFFPDKIRRVFELLPFASMQNMPLRIYSGNITGNEMITGIALQVFWLVVMLATGRLLMGRALRRVVIQGG